MGTMTEEVIRLAQEIAADIKLLATSKVSQANNMLLAPLDPASPSVMTAADTMDIGAANSNLVAVQDGDGSPITSLGAGPVGAWRVLIFSGAVTITHNPAKIILLDGFDMTTVPGTTATFRCNSLGLWQCLSWSYGPGAATRGSPYITIPDYINPALSNMYIYGGAAQYGQPAALVFGMTQLHALPATAQRHIYLPDRNGNLFITPTNTEDPGPPLRFPALSGRYLTAPYNTLEPGEVVANRVYFSAIYLRQPTALTEIGFTVTTEAAPGTMATLVLYRLAGANIVQASGYVPVAIDNPGDVTVNLSGTFVAGVYLIGVRCAGVCSIAFDTPTEGAVAALSALYGSGSPGEDAGATTQLTRDTTGPLLGTSALSLLSFGPGPNPHLWARVA